jgi:hypothetical protein
MKTAVVLAWVSHIFQTFKLPGWAVPTYRIDAVMIFFAYLSL